MKDRPLFFLFVCNLAILFVGYGLFPILPLYATGFGATRATVGLYLSLTYIAITVGTMITDKLTQRFTYQQVLVAVGVLGIPSLVLLGRATALWQVVVLTAIVWFAGGVGLTVASILTALIVPRQSRGKSFGLMTITVPLGSLIGGFIVGALIDWRGYPAMFVVLSAIWVVLPLVGLFGIERDIVCVKAEPDDSPGGRAGVRLGEAFVVLLVASLLSAVAINGSRLGTSLSMQVLEFNGSEIASTATVSGLFTIPAVLAIGVLSDRLGRKRFLMMGYGLVFAAAATLIFATSLWQFWLAATLLLVARSINRSVASALAADMLAPETVGRGMSALNATDYGASIVTFAAIGYVTEAFGETVIYAAGVLLAVAAVWQLSRLRMGTQPDVPKRPVEQFAQPFC